MAHGQAHGPVPAGALTRAVAPARDRADRYWVTVRLATTSQRGVTNKRAEAITGQVRGHWPLAAVIADPGSPVIQTNVVAAFDGPVDAMFVLGVVMNAFEAAGAPVAFRTASITAIQHDHPLAVDDLARE